MKKLTIGLLACIALVSCQKEEKQGNLTITGDIHGLNKGTLYIGQRKDTSVAMIDSVKIDGNSKFSTTIDIKEPEMLYLFLDRGTTNSIDNSLAFFAEPGKINIDTDLETYYAKAKITGSKNHDAYEQFKKIKSGFLEKELEFRGKELEAFKNKTTVSPEEVSKYENTLRRRYLYTVNFAMTNKDKEIAPYLAVSEISNAGLKYLDTINKSLSPKIAKSKYGKELDEWIKLRRKSETTPASVR